jgi:hypothetical protein
MARCKWAAIVAFVGLGPVPATAAGASGSRLEPSLIDLAHRMNRERSR